jgi:hypothetical protein
MTMGPGDYVWERFGHNALLIRDFRSGQDRLYNWGIFSFEDSDFMWRFMRGRMRYLMASEDPLLAIDAYRRSNRSVALQELNLSSAQKAALKQFVETNELPENRYYDYDYYRDNCSTRVRDALDKALGGMLSAQFQGRMTDMTYRDHSRRLMQPDKLTYTGIDIGLGRPTDRPLNAWEEMFIPMSLQRHVREVKVGGPNGEQQPLVLNERVIYEATRAPPPERPASWTLWYLLVGVLIGGVILAVAVTKARPVATFLSVVWCFLAGILGSVLVFLWMATEHVASYQNANLLTLNPLWFVLGGLVIARSRTARPFALLLTALSFAGLLLCLLPNAQDTARVLALMLPIHTGVALAIARRVRVAAV